MRYVVYYFDNLQDGSDEGCKIVDTLEEAVALVERWANGHSGSPHNLDLAIFELGKRVELKEGKEVVKVVKETKRTFKVK